MSGAGGLPPTVRSRVVVLAADALGSMPAEEVPPALRQVARFTPRRRASAAGGQIAAALEDERFRASVSAVVRTGQLATAVAEGTPPETADPVEVAALLWLLRPEGWDGALERSVAEVAAQQELTAQRVHDETVARLESELTAERALRQSETSELRTQVAELKAQLDRVGKDLRRAADRAQRAEAAVRSAETGAAASRVEAERLVGEAEAELRRVQRRLAEAEAAKSTGKAAARRDRDLDTIRLRLLLDAIVGAADGLRRELALPPSELRPADLVGADVEPGGPAAPSQQGRSPDDPAYLDRLLAVPAVHVIIDGYNVTKTGYGAMSLEQQRSRLVSTLGGLAARTGAEITVVFDGAEQQAPVVAPPAPRGVRVMFSDPGEIADVRIARLVGAEPRGRPLVVVSTDGEVRAHAQSAGAHSVLSAALVRLLDRA